MIARTLRLHDTRVFLIAVYVLFNIPIATFFIMGFLAAIPKELEQAALIDGCGHFGILWRIILPLLRPGLAALVVLLMLFTWNEFPLALVLTSKNARTLPVLVKLFVQARSIEWGPMAAVGILSAVPIVTFGIAVQRSLIKGLLTGAVKE
jgi:ABC-type glycerol-3-phosphate transport system permease component